MFADARNLRTNTGARVEVCLLKSTVCIKKCVEEGIEAVTVG